MNFGHSVLGGAIVVSLAATSALLANPAEAVIIGGQPTYSNLTGFPTVLSAGGQFNNGDLTGGFTNVSNIKVGALKLFSGSTQGGFNANYASTNSFITNFAFNDVEAYFDLSAGDAVIQNFIPGRLTSTIALDFSGVIRAVGTGQALAFGKGNVSALIGSSGSGNYSLDFRTEPIPTPALLPGLVGMGLAALRRKKAEEAAEENA